MSVLPTANSKKISTRTLRHYKMRDELPSLAMLTCYDFQTAQLLNQTEIDLILVGDSLGNVVLGLPTTIPVTLDMMKIFGSAVTRGAPDKFVIIDMPFATYATYESAISNCTSVFQQSSAQALKLEGAASETLRIIKRLTEIGVPVMGHIGLTPQSVYELGGYYTHGKDDASAQILMKEALDLQDAGVFSLVLECVSPEVAKKITKNLAIPTIGIGSGQETDGQVLVINDLLGMGPTPPPKFCKPIAQLFQQKKSLIEEYLKNLKKR